MNQILVELISTATIAIALFGVAFSLMQTHYRHVNRSFAAFLACVACNNVPDALSRMLDMMQGSFVQSVSLALWLCSALCLAPTLWIYVYTLTSNAQRWPKSLKRHLILPVLGAVVGAALIVSPDETRASFFSETSLPTEGWALAVLASIAVLQVALYPQLAFYLYLIVRRLVQYKRKLRDVYASTEQHELRWIYVIGGLGGLFWVAQSLILAAALNPNWAFVPMAMLSLFGLALFAATTLWGLRQRPPLVPDAGEDPVGPASTSSPKYENSALSTEASARIARKLRAAMEVDHLHRDPNLSLWALARHTGGSPNYISQTLNEIIGESFFDFVNGYRVAEAMKLLATTDQTVLSITYDVGFNARSSFYNAFKRVTGQTPSQYRKTMSVREGMDDADSVVRHT